MSSGMADDIMRDQILAEIRRIAGERAGKAPGSRLFEIETGISPHRWRGVYWARWGDALAEAGFSPNEKQQRLDADFMLGKVAEAVRHLSKMPTVSELDIYRRNVDASCPTAEALLRNFGGKSGLVERLRSWLPTNPAYEDITTLLPTELVAAPAEKAGKSAAPAEGSVYLLKSGGFYKIGRSDELERRVNEIGVRLPEPLVLIHAIRTDDAPGIEAYWHRRFSDRRIRGEWFRLSAADVAAFRRRSFQ
jgi:hypothetical protein